MKISDIADLINDLEERSWEDALDPADRHGGPSPMGNSKWQVFKQCPYLYQLMFIRKYAKKRKSDALELGGLFHEMLARYFIKDMELRAREEKVPELKIWNQSKLAALDLAHQVEKIAPGLAAEGIRLFKAWQVLNGRGTVAYDCKQTMFIENLVQVHEPFAYSCRFDRVLKTKHGAALQDHKTANKYTDRLVSAYKIDPQFIGQKWLWDRTLAKDYGELEYFEVNLVVKTAEVRVEPIKIYITDSLTKDWVYEMKDLNRELKFRMQNTLRRWPKRRTYRCQFCEAFDHCASEGSLSEWRRKSKGEW
jgi:hypothetical protein